jgi:multiple sugar transport system substrate-binding protein
MFPAYPFHADILYALEHASVRPKTPLYQVVSIDISHLTSPPAGINPNSTMQKMVGDINNALQSRGLVP